ncbi:carbamoyltransferase HypF [Sulfurimonas sp. ST-27]|uniref:carbamoyltransferase HypF n=1 Tax=Sulfurimonas sp. ST-27 TaxID=3400152 RepID=UPI003AB803A2
MSAESICRKKIYISGIVQGVGFRPFIYALANRYRLCGFVFNDGNGVVVEVQGENETLLEFIKEIDFSAPPLSRIDTLGIEDIQLKSDDGFSIVKSQDSALSTMLSPDMTLCDDCKREMFDKKNRRYMYPFINCINCGPRYTIIKNLPYDRKNTSMQNFTMCDTCKEEYEDSTNRRYHAQPISCYDCGPKLEFVSLMEECQAQNNEAVEKICECIKSGKTVAVKGLGGFHLVCDARNEEAVMLLRINKHRPSKPLAVMFENIESLQKICQVSKREKELIVSKERPIVLVKKKSQQQVLCKYIAPNIDKIGAFLPYTPLHELILKKLKFPIVATSANLSDEPIIQDQKELFKKLPLVVEVSLNHDREIINGCDDSVMMQIADQNITLRLARGFAPLSFVTKIQKSKKILALGAQQKSTITLAFEGNIVISPHIGDLNTVGAMEYFRQTVQTFQRLYNFQPDIIVCDKHPGYETTKWAKEYIQNHPLCELIQLQHHYAHALGTMAEYDLDEEVLVFCFDGTGFGDDGVLWGGEVLLATPKAYKRVCHMEEFFLIGGEKAIKEPKRVALSLLFDIFSLEEIKSMPNDFVSSLDKKEIQTLYLMRNRGINSIQTTSVGRLFDAVYALCGFLNPLGHEGESGMIMESLAREFKTRKKYTFEVKDDVISCKNLIKEILAEEKKELIPAKFMNALAAMIIQISLQHKNKRVILSGGVFQNSYLLEKVVSLFQKNHIKYNIASKVPVNDGGISLGQAYYALHQNSIKENYE